MYFVSWMGFVSFIWECVPGSSLTLYFLLNLRKNNEWMNLDNHEWIITWVLIWNNPRRISYSQFSLIKSILISEKQTQRFFHFYFIILTFDELTFNDMKTLISTYFRNPFEFSYIDKIRMLLSVPIKYKHIDKFRQCASRKHYIYPSTATDLHYPSASAADTIIFFDLQFVRDFFFFQTMCSTSSTPHSLLFSDLLPLSCASSIGSWARQEAQFSSGRIPGAVSRLSSAQTSRQAQGENFKVYTWITGSLKLRKDMKFVMNSKVI